VETVLLTPVLVEVAHLLLAVMLHTTQAQREVTGPLGVTALHTLGAVVARPTAPTPQAALAVAVLLGVAEALQEPLILAAVVEPEAHPALVATAALAL
jgi:hypothetical protein